MRQARWWILTIPAHDFTPYLPATVAYIRGQLERGVSTAYAHWQVVVYFAAKVALASVRRVFGAVHAEPSRSAAAVDYVWKDDTAVVGTRFELGERPFRRNSRTDWDGVWASAAAGDLLAVPSDVRVRCYHQLRRIGADFAVPVAMERHVCVFWGPTGTGKSRAAWEAAGMGAYPKDPRTKWWCGYRGQSTCVIDEFRGSVDVAHLLRWFDRYPVSVEQKGGSVPLRVERFWITSNLSPREWYPDLDEATMSALLRRLNVVHMPLQLN